MVQLENLVNIGISQREAATGVLYEEGEGEEDGPRFENKYLEENEGDKAAQARAARLERNRMLKLLLTDGVNYVIAVEMQKIFGISTRSQPGTKLLLRGEI